MNTQFNDDRASFFKHFHDGTFRIIKNYMYIQLFKVRLCLKLSVVKQVKTNEKYCMI